jgi:enamine deaminase RidA (YjgF/YER057c/UK114 family)
MRGDASSHGGPLMMRRVPVAVALIAIIVSMLLIAAPADAQARREGTVLMSENPGAREFQENWGYSEAIIVGDSIYLSGIVVGRAPDDKDLGASYERVYSRIENILKRAGASWDDVIDIASFHTDVEGQIEAMAAVHKKYVKAPYPAWTAIGVAKILGGGITEIKIVARRPSAPKSGE